MDTRIELIAEMAVEALRAAGYAESTVGQYRKGFRYLSAHSADGLYGDEAREAFLSERKPDGAAFERNYQVFRERIVALCDDWVATGSFDLGVRSRRTAQPSPSSPALGGLLAEYGRSNEERGLAMETQDHYLRLAREYLLFLEARGAADIVAADPASVLAFMSDIASRWKGTSTYHLASNFRPFLRYLGRDDLVEALRLSNPVRDRGIVPMLDDEQESSVVAACLDGSVDARDAAVTLLALTTGLRACDIVALQLADVNWHSMTLAIVQSKTGNPVTVPMQPAVAEAMARYVLDCRPESAHGNVFLRSPAPHGPFRDHSAIYDITRRTLAKAGVDGGGCRLLRHSAASRMLRAGARLPVISAVLGHASPDSTDVYLEADEEAMRACVLPLPKAAVA